MSTQKTQNGVTKAKKWGGYEWFMLGLVVGVALSIITVVFTQQFVITSQSQAQAIGTTNGVLFIYGGPTAAGGQVFELTDGVSLQSWALPVMAAKNGVYDAKLVVTRNSELNAGQFGKVIVAPGSYLIRIEIPKGFKTDTDSNLFTLNKTNSMPTQLPVWLTAN
jgi:hypothetical protein